MWMGSRAGRHLDANFIIRSANPLVIFYEAAGGSKDRARNTEYSTGLIELLRRLGELDAVVDDIRVETAVTQGLDLEERRVRLKRHSYPVSLGSLPEHSFATLKSDISTAARRPGRQPGSSGGGSSRNLEIHLSPLAMSAEGLARYLSEVR